MTLANVKHMISTERFACRIDAAQGLYSLYDILKNQFVIEGATLAIQAPGPAASRNLLFAGDDLVLDQDASIADASSATLVYNHAKYPIGMTAEWCANEEDPSELTVRIAFENKGQKAFGLRALLPLLIDPQRDANIDLGGVWSHGAMLRNGLSSGSDCNIEHFSKPDGTDYESHSFTLLHHLFSRRNLALGFITVKDQFSRIVATPDTDGMHMSAICECDDVRVEAGQTFWSETLWMRLTDGENDQINRYLSLSAASAGTRPTLLEQVPTIWAVESFPGAPINTDGLTARLSALSARKRGFPVQCVLVADGWQSCVGDWQTVDRGRFKDGLKGIATKISDAGFTPGLWLAPFIAQANSALYLDHPDWFLRDASGTAINVMERRNPTCYALDLTNDGVIEWLVRTIKTITADCGFRYLKLDNLNASIVETGVRSGMHFTRAQAYRRALEAIRTAAGSDVYLAGGGAPLAQSVGLLDSCRTGAEILTSWETPGISDGIRIPGRNSIIRTNMHGRWFHNDPGWLQARFEESDDSAAVDERETLQTLIGLSAGALTLCGDPAKLSEDEMDGLRFLLPQLPQSAVVSHPMSRHSVPNCSVISLQNHCVVAVYNWGDMPEQATIDLDDLGLNRNLRHVVFDVKEQYLVSNHLVREWVGHLLAPHSVRVMHFALAPSGSKPMLVGSTFHIGQGAVELSSYDWTPRMMTLSLSLPYWVGREGALTFYAPDIDSAALESVTGASDVEIEVEDQQGGRALLIILGKVESARVTLSVAIRTK